MAFLFWKRFKTISDLRTADLKLKKVRRSDVKIAIIDDEPIEIMDILKSHKFNIDLIPKIESINILGEYDANTMSGNPDATLGSTNIAKLFVLLLFKKL